MRLIEELDISTGEDWCHVRRLSTGGIGFKARFPKECKCRGKS